MIFKVMFIISIIFLLSVSSATVYFVMEKKVELAVILGMLTGATILNCGNIYGYIVNERWVKKYEGNQCI